MIYYLNIQGVKKYWVLVFDWEKFSGVLNHLVECEEGRSVTLRFFTCSPLHCLEAKGTYLVSFVYDNAPGFG